MIFMSNTEDTIAFHYLTECLNCSGNPKHLRCVGLQPNLNFLKLSKGSQFALYGKLLAYTADSILLCKISFYLTCNYLIE